MAAEQALLLVEGERDKAFFVELCRKWQLHPHIQIAPPKEVGGTNNTKQGVYNHLPRLLRQINDGSLKQLAVVLDADTQAVNPPDGFSNTLNKVKAIVEPFGYETLNRHGLTDGFIFKNNDGLPDFGLWIMPNNQDEGMLEDFLKACICADEQPLFAHAAQSIAALATPKFKPHHNSKAEVATWLAWQKTPGHGLYAAVNDNLLDTDEPLFRQLGAWLQSIYQPLA